MKSLIRIACAVLLLSLSPAAFAGEIFGKVLKDGAPVGEGAATITVTCGDQAGEPVKTDRSGSYHLVAPATGKCTMAVAHGGETASLTVASYEEAVQVDLLLESQGGKLTVRRK